MEDPMLSNQRAGKGDDDRDALTDEEIQRAINRTPAAGVPQFDKLVDELCLANAPRRFALCVVDGDWRDVAIAHWGPEFDDGALLTNSDGGFTGSFSSVERAARLFGRLRRLRVVWLDAPYDEH
jgi:hypothetical protein